MIRPVLYSDRAEAAAVRRLHKLIDDPRVTLMQTMLYSMVVEEEKIVRLSIDGGYVSCKIDYPPDHTP